MLICDNFMVFPKKMKLCEATSGVLEMKHLFIFSDTIYCIKQGVFISLIFIFMSEDISVDKILEKILQKPPAPLTKEEVFFACEKVMELLIKENNLIQLEAPITVVGDLHGQLYDFLEIFKLQQGPPESKFLFLGDYVDRGYYGIEVLMYLVCLKIKYPDRVYLLRGNHECAHITFTYGFYQECLEKFGTSTVSQKCCEMFMFLPISAKIGSSIVCMHGGLSPSIHLTDQINALTRFREPTEEGPLADLLWSDPDNRVKGFAPSKRGVGYFFGADACARFHHFNRTKTLIRAHQLANQGYEFHFDNHCITIWSAPNYCYRPTNYASVASISDIDGVQTVSINVFAAVPDSESTVPPSKQVLSDYFV